MDNPFINTLPLHGFAQPPYTAMKSPFVDDYNQKKRVQGYGLEFFSTYTYYSQNSHWSATLDEKETLPGLTSMQMSSCV